MSKSGSLVDVRRALPIAPRTASAIESGSANTFTAAGGIRITAGCIASGVLPLSSCAISSIGCCNGKWPRPSAVAKLSRIIIALGLSHASCVCL